MKWIIVLALIGFMEPAFGQTDTTAAQTNYDKLITPLTARALSVLSLLTSANSMASNNDSLIVNQQNLRLMAARIRSLSVNLFYDWKQIEPPFGREKIDSVFGDALKSLRGAAVALDAFSKELMPEQRENALQLTKEAGDYLKSYRKLKRTLSLTTE
jgi:hypothetical protein